MKVTVYAWNCLTSGLRRLEFRTWESLRTDYREGQVYSRVREFIATGQRRRSQLMPGNA
jgi:hypothetical protein